MYYYYGLPRQDKGTGVVSEDTLRNLIIDKLKSAGDIGFDRVHRLSSKPPPVVSRCAFFEDKVKIVKAKRKRERETSLPVSMVFDMFVSKHIKQYELINI